MDAKVFYDLIRCDKCRTKSGVKFESAKGYMICEDCYDSLPTFGEVKDEQD